jgi:hypothetical protein
VRHVRREILMGIECKEASSLQTVTDFKGGAATRLIRIFELDGRKPINILRKAVS